MDFRTYFYSLDDKTRARFAKKCQSSVGHFGNVIAGSRQVGPKLAVLIERHSGGLVTRQEIRSDWVEIWPELKRTRKSKKADAWALMKESDLVYQG